MFMMINDYDHDDYDHDDYDHDDCDRMILPEDYFRVPDKSVGRLIDWLIKIRIMVMLMMIFMMYSAMKFFLHWRQSGVSE